MKKIALFAAIAAGSLAIAACGEKKEEAAMTSEETAASTEAAPAGSEDAMAASTDATATEAAK